MDTEVKNVIPLITTQRKKEKYSVFLWLYALWDLSSVTKDSAQAAAVKVFES